MPQDLWSLVYSFAYVAAVLGLGEGLRLAGVATGLTRKLVHLGAGLWVVPTVLLFSDWRWAMVPPMAAVAMNWVSLRRRLFRSIEQDEPSYGTVYFPISLALCIALFWDRPHAITAGILAMAAGDPAAAIVGRRVGWGSYQNQLAGAPGDAGPVGQTKTLAGSLAMFAGALLAVGPALALVHGWSWPSALEAATVLAAAAALLEAPGRRGSDNLSVPLGVAALAGLSLPWGTLAAGVWLSLAIAALAYRRRALAESGVFGAVITGTLAFGFGGWPVGVSLVAFFVASSLLSRLAGRRKAAAEQVYAKGSRRDLGQALANGGMAAGLAVLAWHTGDPRWLAAAAGALAAACADTWATEIGAFSHGAPRLVTSWRPVPAGTSGAVSLPGLAASAAGALFVAAVAVLAGLPKAYSLAVAAAGLAGSLADSLLGATVQGIYRCRVCRRETEKPVHHGQPAAPVRGWRWLGNDLVNLAATGVGALVAFVLA